MVDPLLTSRRSFLKLLGGTAALLAVPSTVIALAPVPPTIPEAALLPPNILHVLDGDTWHAFLGIRDIFLRQEEGFDVFRELGTLDRAVRPVFNNAGEIGVEGVLARGGPARILDRFMRECEVRRFALSLSNYGYEFEAFPLEVEEVVHSMLPPSARLGLSIDSDITMRLLS